MRSWHTSPAAFLAFSVVCAVVAGGITAFAFDLLP